MIKLRDYQIKLRDDVYTTWRDGHKNVIAVAPTGSGKTRIISDIILNCGVPCVAIAHRQELVSQISLALAENGVYHNVMAPQSVIDFCITRHVDVCGKKYHRASSNVHVAGVQTLLRRVTPRMKRDIKLWVTDEAHHLLPKNQWGKAAALFPNAYGLGVTASPIRCDNQPLGAQHGGVFDKMVSGPTMRELIDVKYLADYRIFAPKSSINRDTIKRSQATGDFSQHALRKELEKSTITGDIVSHYQKIAMGKRGITFVVGVDMAHEVAEKYNNVGIPAEAISAKTADRVRQNAIRKFENGDILQLVNVDLFGEGFDVPAVEVVSMGRPTESFGLYLQQFGRALRPLQGKTHGIIIDHVGNVMRHGLPDAYREWTLDQPIKGVKGQRDPNIMPVRTCESCFSAYEATTDTCPYCGHITLPQGRSRPEYVDGDLIEFDTKLLEELRGKIGAVMNGHPALPTNASPMVINAVKKNWKNRQQAQLDLKSAINLWAGIQVTVNGKTDSEAYRIFYHTYGVDVLTAQIADRLTMITLTEVIRRTWE